MKRPLILIFVVAGCMVTGMAHAAYIYLEPAQTSKNIGESFSVNIRLNTEGQSINAVELTLSYPPLLQATSVAKGSAVQLWVEEPSFSGSTLKLTGGSPGGINSTNALLARATFSAKSVGEGGITIGGGSSVLLNDGQGTSVPLRIITNIFKVNPRGQSTSTPTPGRSGTPTKTPADTPTESELPTTTPDEVGADTRKPQKFSVTVGKDPRVFDGKHFVSFFTTDEESGVERYEISEGAGPFRIARTPYLLEDQKLRSVIRVRAYDMAGNFRETKHPGVLKRFFLWIINLF